MTVAIDSLAGMSGGRIEQRALLRSEQPPADTTLVVRGGRDTVDKLRVHAERPARAWSLDGLPLLGYLGLRGLGMPLEVLLRGVSPASARSTCRPQASWASTGSS